MLMLPKDPCCHDEDIPVAVSTEEGAPAQAAGRPPSRGGGDWFNGDWFNGACTLLREAPMSQCVGLGSGLRVRTELCLGGYLETRWLEPQGQRGGHLGRLKYNISLKTLCTLGVFC